jgi:hypothetical protein
MVLVEWEAREKNTRRFRYNIIIVIDIPFVHVERYKKKSEKKPKKWLMHQITTIFHERTRFDHEYFYIFPFVQFHITLGLVYKKSI